MKSIELPEPGFSLAEVSQLASVGKSSVYEWVHKKELPAYRAADGTMKVSRLDLAVFMAEREKQRQ
jgi:excisionase family DNA binding protein